MPGWAVHVGKVDGVVERETDSNDPEHTLQHRELPFLDHFFFFCIFHFCERAGQEPDNGPGRIHFTIKRIHFTITLLFMIHMIMRELQSWYLWSCIFPRRGEKNDAKAKQFIKNKMPHYQSRSYAPAQRCTLWATIDYNFENDEVLFNYSEAYWWDPKNLLWW